MRIKGIPVSRIPKLLAPQRVSFDRPLHVFVSVCDHYEPMWLNPARHVQDARVERWVREYPQAVAGLCDSTGRPPQHTFFT